MKGFILYKIYYGDNLIYLGRTKQKLQDRIRGHFFGKSMHRKINIENVTKIEYAELTSEADMFLYEIYYINKLKPHLNVDDKARDDLSIVIQDIEFKEYYCKLMDKWVAQIKEVKREEEFARKQKRLRLEQKREMRKKWHKGEITKEEYYDFVEKNIG